MAGIPASSIMMLQTTILRQMSKPIFSVKEFQKNIVQSNCVRWDFSWIIREFLLLMSFFPEITNNCLTYRPNFGRIKKQFDLGRVISVADKGMTTGDNIWYTINTPLMTDMFSVCPSGAQKKASRTMFWNRKVMNGLVQNTSGNPASLQERSRYPLFPAKR